MKASQPNAPKGMLRHSETQVFLWMLVKTEETCINLAYVSDN